MGNFVTYEGIVAYAKQLLISFAQNSKVAIFNDPTNQILTIKGKETAIREVSTAGAGDYTGAWGDGAGQAEVDYKNYYAPYDRGFSASVDTLKEAASFMEGAKPSLVGVAQEFNKAQLAPEIDSVILARFANQAGIKKVVTDSGYAVDKDNILATLTNIQADISNAGYDGDIVVYLDATTNAALTQALVGSNIIANEEVITRQMTKDEVAEGFGALEITLKVRRIDNLLIVSVPEARMANKYIMLNGIDAGQENGGVLPYKNLSTFAQNRIIAIPIEAAYANIRHIVSNLFVPAGISAEEYSEDIALANEKLFGVLALENVGVNPFGDGFKFNERCVYGGDIFEKYRDAAVVVTSAAGAVTVAPTTAYTEDTAISGAKTTTKDVKVYVGALNASGTVYFASATTASATVDASEVLTVPSEGADDPRPYCSPTVTFGNTAGSSKISIYSDSNKTVKIGEFTATSEG